MPFEKGNKLSNGRPKARHTIESELMRAELVKAVKKKMPELLKAKFDLALGHKESINGESVYRKAPDGNAIQYLLNQVIGKALEKVETDNPNQLEYIEKLSQQVKEWIGK